MPPRQVKAPKEPAKPVWEFRTPEMIFRRRRAIPGLLEAFGFRPADQGRSLCYETPLVDGMFTMVVNVDEGGCVTTRLVDRMGGGEFVQHLVPAAGGTFVGRVRREFDDVLDRIDMACFADIA